MPSNVCVPFFKPGQDVTGYLTENIGGKRFVAPAVGGRGSQPHIRIAPAGALPAGVLGHDGSLGDFIHFNIGGTVPVVAGADIVAGTPVMVGAGGAAVPWAASATAGVTNWVAGLATANAAAGGAVPVQLNLG